MSKEVKLEKFGPREIIYRAKIAGNVLGSDRLSVSSRVCTDKWEHGWTSTTLGALSVSITIS